MKQIIVTTNPYQAQRNVLFAPHKTTAVLDQNISDDEAIERLKEIAFNVVNDDTMPFETPSDFIYPVIDEQLSAIYGRYTDDQSAAYCEAHKASIEAMAKRNGYEKPGLYMDGRLIYAFGDESFEYDGYYYKIENMKETYELLNEATAGEREGIATLVEVDNRDIEVREDASNWYIDLNTGLGFGQYPKADFTLEEALNDDNF